ncbi:MAG: YicC/YloC family endoribonuclease [Chlamydiota bacterium]
MRSMTGFGKASISSENGTFFVEIQAWNRKHLEVITYLPKEFFCMEVDVKKEVGKKNFRGQIVVRVSFIPNVKMIQSLFPDKKLMETLKQGWESLAKDLKIKEEITLSFLMNQLETFSQKGSTVACEDCKEDILQGVKGAVEALMAAKEEEGKSLSLDMMKKWDLIEGWMQEITTRAPYMTSIYREKLKTRVEELIGKSPDYEDRIAREVVMFSERVDISEELVRFQTHFEKCRGLMHSSGSVGRELDFLIQEMNREINTLSTKALDATISSFAVQIKCTLEKNREQIQNIE